MKYAPLRIWTLRPGRRLATTAARLLAGMACVQLACLLVLLLARSAQAATASAEVPISVTVNNPTCTLSNDNASVVLPPAASPNQTWTQYIGANGFTTAGTRTVWSHVTSSALNQTLTIRCTTANVPIQSIIVQPAAGATLHSSCPGAAYLVDATSPTPVKAAGGNGLLSYEQVSVNGVAAPWAYASNAATCALRYYATAFTTGELMGGESIATVVWRPQFDPDGTTSIGTPTGGQYGTTVTAVINY